MILLLLDVIEHQDVATYEDAYVVAASFGLHGECPEYSTQASISHETIGKVCVLIRKAQVEGISVAQMVERERVRYIAQLEHLMFEI